jgi:enoyl-CoA hydratase
MQDLIAVERDANIAVVTLNRPEKLNALSRALMKALVSAFRELKSDREIAAVILTGAGKAFCAGVDLEELANNDNKAFSLGKEYKIQTAILDFDRPIIGAINGIAATGGFELALWCDMLIASQRARFADTHARVGVIPGWGLSQRLSRIIGINRARELSFTGNFLSAEQAESWGLVNRVVAPEELLPTCKLLAQDMASCNRETLICYKRVINEGAGMDLNTALEYERSAMDLYVAGPSGNSIAQRIDDVMARGRESTTD